MNTTNEIHPTRQTISFQPQAPKLRLPPLLSWYQLRRRAFPILGYTILAVWLLSSLFVGGLYLSSILPASITIGALLWIKSNDQAPEVKKTKTNTLNNKS